MTSNAAMKELNNIHLINVLNRAGINIRSSRTVKRSYLPVVLKDVKSKIECNYLITKILFGFNTC